MSSVTIKQEASQFKMLEQLQSYLTQVVYAHDQKPLELTVCIGSCKEAERDMVIAAYHAATLVENSVQGFSGYENSDECREIEEYLYKRLCYYFNSDVAEDDLCSSGMETMTACETALSKLAKLLFISEPTSAKLVSTGDYDSFFIVGLESSYDWSDWKTCLEDDDFELHRHFTTFQDEQLTEDCGWEQEEVTELASALPFTIFNCYSSQCHTMIKII